MLHFVSGLCQRGKWQHYKWHQGAWISCPNVSLHLINILFILLKADVWLLLLKISLNLRLGAELFFLEISGYFLDRPFLNLLFDTVIILAVKHLTHHAIINFSNQAYFSDSYSFTVMLLFPSVLSFQLFYYLFFVYMLFFRLAEKKVVRINPSSTASEVWGSLCLDNYLTAKFGFLNSCAYAAQSKNGPHTTCDKHICLL